MQRRFIKFSSIFIIVFQRSVVTMVSYATGHWSSYVFNNLFELI